MVSQEVSYLPSSPTVSEFLITMAVKRAALGSVIPSPAMTVCMFFKKQPELPCRGNILLTRLTGARMILCPMKPECTLTEHVIVMQEKMKEYAAKLE